MTAPSMRDKAPLASRTGAWLCAALFLIALLIAHPWVETPILDDWSYIRSSQVLAATGHIAYNAWATAMIGWQLYAGALMSKLFGFSFTAPRVSIMLVGALTVFLMHRTLVRFGVSGRNAVVVALAMSLSPMYTQLSATFMSDIPGLLAVVACFYCCLRALQAANDSRAALWICAASLGNAILGSSRQVAWLGVLVLVPSTLWLLRRRRAVLLAGGIMELFGVAIMAALMHWYSHQPYALSDTSFMHVRNWNLSHIAIEETQAVLESWLLALPLLIAFLPSPRKYKPTFLSLLVAIGAVIAIFAHHAAKTGQDFPLAAPFIQNWYTKFGYFNIEFPIQQAPPIVLTLPWIIVLNIFFYGGLVCLVRFLWKKRELLNEAPATEPGRIGWHELALLLGPFTLAYFALLIPRASGSLADRYCLPLAFVAAVFLARLWDDTQHRPLPLRTIIATALIALYSIAATHDLFAYYGAKKSLAAEVTQTGVPLTQLDAGWDFDGWTELQHASYINDLRLKNPAGAYQPVPDANQTPCFLSAFADLFPHVKPVYGIRLNPNDCLGATSFTPVAYAEWLRFGRPTTFYVVRYR